MITNALLNILILFLNGIIALLSSRQDVLPNNDITNAVLTADGYYSAMNAYFPVDTILAIVTFWLLFEFLYFGYKLIKWAYSKVPGIT